MADTLQDRIVADLTTELGDEADFSADILAIKVRNAINDVKLRRNYRATSYSEERINEDMERFYSTITNIARYDYNQRGVEGQSSHSEGIYNRTWVDRDKLFRGVNAFVSIF